MRRILGIDYGTVRVGVAVSDAMGWTAQPLEFLSRKKDGEDMRRLAEIIEEYEVQEFVIGLPLNMDGTEGDMAKQARAYGERLKETFNLPLHEWDERLTSVMAEKILIEGNVRRDKRKQKVDKIAAAIMLQGYLDAHQR